MQIRRAGLDDLDVIAALFDAYRQFYSQPSDLAGARSFLRQRLEQRESVIFLAEMDASAAGFVQLYPIFTSVGMRRVWLLNDLYVAAAARRAGAATALMNAAHAMAREDDAAGVMLETHTGNRDAQALYEKLGYKRNSATWFYYLSLV